MTYVLEPTDHGLLELAETVLRDAGYEVARGPTELPSVLLAENDDSVAVIAAPVTLEQLLDAEPLVSRLLSERLLASVPNNKRWDAFVVLLCAQEALAEQTEPVAEVVNNLRYVRRLVRLGVEPTRAAVSRSLRPLLPLPDKTADRLQDPLKELEKLLLRDGLNPTVVDEAMDDFTLNSAASAEIFEGDDVVEELEIEDS